MAFVRGISSQSITGIALPPGELATIASKATLLGGFTPWVMSLRRKANHSQFNARRFLHNNGQSRPRQTAAAVCSDGNRRG